MASQQRRAIPLGGGPIKEVEASQAKPSDRSCSTSIRRPRKRVAASQQHTSDNSYAKTGLGPAPAKARRLKPIISPQKQPAARLKSRLGLWSAGVAHDSAADTGSSLQPPQHHGEVGGLSLLWRSLFTGTSPSCSTAPVATKNGHAEAPRAIKKGVRPSVPRKDSSGSKAKGPGRAPNRREREPVESPFRVATPCRRGVWQDHRAATVSSASSESAATAKVPAATEATTTAPKAANSTKSTQIQQPPQRPQQTEPRAAPRSLDKISSTGSCAEQQQRQRQQQQQQQQQQGLSSAFVNVPTSKELGQAPRLPIAAPAAPEHMDAKCSVTLSKKISQAEVEVSRILGLPREATDLRVPAWHFALLQLKPWDATPAAVQHAYRELMRHLHPDRAGQLAGAREAIELLRQAKVECERVLAREVPPSMPSCLTARLMCSHPGRRRVRLEWAAPAELTSPQQAPPVRSYVVAAFDPDFGKALTVAVLEPDYNEDLHRFVPIEELVSCTLAEEELQKMPGFFRQPLATVQVAAVNRSGQSPWAMAKVSLVKLVPASKMAPSARKGESRPAKHRTVHALRPPPESKSTETEFEAQMRMHKGKGLQIWLAGQKRELLTVWLRARSWPSCGSRDELIERAALVAEGGA